MLRRSFASASLSAALAIVSACGDDDGHHDDDDHAHSAVGALAGSSDTFFAAVSDSTAITAYVCDADRVAFWFQGDVTDGAFSITTEAGVLAGTVGEEGATQATFTPTGGTAAMATATGVGQATSGVYNGGATIGDEEVTASIIVRDDGEQRGVVTSRPREVMAEPMIMPSPMIMPDPMGIASVAFATGSVDVNRIVSPRDPIVSPR